MPFSKGEVVSRTIRPNKPSNRPIQKGTDGTVIESDDEDMSDSAITDDDDSEWKDSVTESGRSSMDEKKLFQRVNLKPNLSSRRSLLTMMIQCQSTPALQRSLHSSPNGPSVGASPVDSKPIMVNYQPSSPPHSPKTTRRNMRRYPP